MAATAVPSYALVVCQGRACDCQLDWLEYGTATSSQGFHRNRSWRRTAPDRFPDHRCFCVGACHAGIGYCGFQPILHQNRRPGDLSFGAAKPRGLCPLQSRRRCLAKDNQDDGINFLPADSWTTCVPSPICPRPIACHHRDGPLARRQRSHFGL